MNEEGIKAVALAGGVGGAKLADGLAQILPPENLTVIVNTGDDFEHLGLTICPDLDTVCYTLAGIANPATGWGRSAETYQALETLGELAGPTWFRLGDRDLGLHLERTRLMRSGKTLSQVTQHICHAFGVNCTVLPMSDDPTPTWVYTKDGTLSFQEYFVRRRCQPEVTGFNFADIEQSKPAPGVLEAVQAADLVVICPSNPWVSIGPILAVPGLSAAIETRRVVAVSPIVGGQALKGPAAKMYCEMGIDPSALSVAKHYAGLLSGMVMDQLDEGLCAEIARLGMRTLVTNTLMKTGADRKRLAGEVIQFGVGLI